MSVMTYTIVNDKAASTNGSKDSELESITEEGIDMQSEAHSKNVNPGRTTEEEASRRKSFWSFMSSVVGDPYARVQQTYHRLWRFGRDLKSPARSK
ncbi:hypothetical protein HY486_00475 [Candidatus Woesearchaeota archaeon]|nr:hypothetical protein [Candidatus Woesearchaeota archaeon]